MCLATQIGRGPMRVARVRIGLAIAEESLAAIVHVVLDVAVEEGEAGLVGGELDGGAAARHAR